MSNTFNTVCKLKLFPCLMPIIILQEWDTWYSSPRSVYLLVTRLCTSCGWLRDCSYSVRLYVQSHFVLRSNRLIWLRRAWWRFSAATSAAYGPWCPSYTAKKALLGSLPKQSCNTRYMLIKYSVVILIFKFISIPHLIDSSVLHGGLPSRVTIRTHPHGTNTLRATP